MELRQLLGAVALLLCSSHSYSEVVYGSTGNAASAGYNWVMTNILPQQAGLMVNGVFYRYSTVKDTDDEMLVHIQNEDALGPGYIFRETDDWTGLPGNSITKNVPVPLIDIGRWGPGSIEVEGKGEVVDAEVLYTYQYDPCFDPQTSPDCPGYIDPYLMGLEDPNVVDPLDEDYIQAELDRKAQLRAEEEEQENRERRQIAKDAENDNDERLEDLLGIELASTEYSIEQTNLHNNLTRLVGIPVAYTYSIDGGAYNDTVVLQDATLPKNRRALSVGLAQDLRHQELVNLQYVK